MLTDVLPPRTVLWQGTPVAGFATRWIDGLPLTDGAAPLPLPARLALFVQLLDAVGFLHRQGVLHLDLKPSNTLVGGGALTLLDLGSARPLDAGPGEAGGTLGYAAPEVLAGQAASVGADLFSLGAILYALLTGTSAYGDLPPAELRRAALSGEIVPVRAVSPDTPPALARLTEALLAPEAADRPGDVEAVLAALADAAIPVETHPGAPPLVGRGEQRARLHQWLDGPEAHRIALVGPPGSGRTRLARAALRSHGRWWFDLPLTRDPLRTLDGLACLAGADVPARSARAARIRAVGAGLEAWPGPPATVFLGRRSEHPPDMLRTLDALVPSLLAGGIMVVAAAAEPPHGAITLPVGPLEDAACVELGLGFGWSHASRVRELAARAGGYPGGLVHLLARGDAGTPPSSGLDEGALALLAILPPGIPASLLPHLPLPEAARRALKPAPDGRVYVEAESGGTLAPEVRSAALRALVERPPLDAPVWMALALARLGALDAAREAWRALSVEPSAPQSLVVSLLEAMADAGERDAQVALALQRERDGDLAAAADLLLALERRSVDEETRLVHVLRRAGRLDEAVAHAEAALARAPDGALWLELAHALVKRRALADAERACAQAEALDPSLKDGAALSLRVAITVRRMSQGERPEGLEALLLRVEAHADGLDSATLSSAGRIVLITGQLERGERMLARASERADAEGDVRRSAGIRLNRGNALQRLGRARQARELYREALPIAQDARESGLVLRIRYSLADLELRMGRVPAAETQVRAFSAEARTAQDPGLTARAAELHARLLLARGRPEEALEALRGVSLEGRPPVFALSIRLARAQALLDLGRATEVLPVLADAPQTGIAMTDADVESLRGRAHLALARGHLAAARRAVPDDPDPMERQEAGRVLLSAAGEDLDPETFGARRDDLDHAARLLRGAEAASAATLRDRFLEGPGANLEGVVALTEAMHDPEAFPDALANLVSQALGAYRVLIMLPMPGGGQQMTYRELTGAEAAGIGQEVLRRIRKPDDVWLAHNAFADPHLRETSQAVRTFELKSLLAVAIPRGDRALGALYVDDLHRTNRFTEADIAILRRLATGVGRMLRNLAPTGMLEEPEEVLGVLLGRHDKVAAQREREGVLRGADRPLNVLVTGPTGSGKSVLAGRIAGALGLDGVETVVLRQGDPQFLITQLMGARRGEFTGATDREGAIQRCLKRGRALFLDEIQNLDEAGQQILLPLLDLPRHFASLTGSSSAIEGRLHVVLGTNARVENGGWANHFREDLWYRMTSLQIDLPPLADRGPEVVYQYLHRMMHEAGAPSPEVVFEGGAIFRVTGWSWPGNLRQLARFAERATHLHRARGEARPGGARRGVARSPSP